MNSFLPSLKVLERTGFCFLLKEAQCSYKAKTHEHREIYGYEDLDVVT